MRKSRNPWAQLEEVLEVAEEALEEERQEVVPGVVGEALVHREDEEALVHLAAGAVAVASPGAEVVPEEDLAEVSEDVVNRLARSNLLSYWRWGIRNLSPRILLLR